MNVATLRLGNRDYAVIPMTEFRRLTRNQKPPAKRNGKATRRLSRQDRGDIAEARRALADPRRIPAQDVFRHTGR